MGTVLRAEVQKAKVESLADAAKACSDSAACVGFSFQPGGEIQAEFSAEFACKRTPGWHVLHRNHMVLEDKEEAPRDDPRRRRAPAPAEAPAPAPLGGEAPRESLGLRGCPRKSSSSASGDGGMASDAGEGMACGQSAAPRAPGGAQPGRKTGHGPVAVVGQAGVQRT